MHNNFKDYSQYYDLLYQDKNYTAETTYLVDLIKKYRPTSKSIIELGSGTGKHANLLAENGFKVHGLERSAEMVEIANQAKKEQVAFQVADITQFKMDATFDVALSLFHVISYLNSNQDLINTFKNVHGSLNEDGLFIFDVWHSSAVYHQIPEKRTKVLTSHEIEVVRHATPIIFSELNVVEVNYDININNLSTGKTQKIEEKHPMRHFSAPEIEILAYATGFEVLHTEEFLTKAPASQSTWGVCYILKRINK